MSERVSLTHCVFASLWIPHPHPIPFIRSDLTCNICVLNVSLCLQAILDGCRRCFWVQSEPTSIFVPSHPRNLTSTSQQQQQQQQYQSSSSRLLSDVNSTLDTALLVVELMVASAPAGAPMAADMHTIVSFLATCPQANIVSEVHTAQAARLVAVVVILLCVFFVFQGRFSFV